MMIETVEALVEGAAISGDGPATLTQAELTWIAGGGGGAGINPSRACYGPAPRELASWVPPGGYEP
jgi:hypothetical protein